MASKGKVRSRKIGFWLIGIVSVLLLLAYAPMIEKAYEELAHSNKAQEVHGIITVAKTPTQAQENVVTEKFCNHIVTKGDTLTKLATWANEPISVIAKRNNIKNIDIIRIGQVITLRITNAPSDMAVSKASSEKFVGHAGASQKKPLTKSLAKRKHDVSRAKNKSLQPVIGVQHGNCSLIGGRIRNAEDRIIARADCIRHHYGDLIKDAVASQEHQVSTLEIIAIMLYESQGNPRAVSKARVPCLGLMQLQPPTARQYGVRAMFDPRENILGGVRVFADYTYRYGGGNKSFGLAAYNMGPHNRTLQKVGFSPQRLKYVRDVEQILHTLESRQFTL